MPTTMPCVNPVPCESPDRSVRFFQLAVRFMRALTWGQEENLPAALKEHRSYIQGFLDRYTGPELQAFGACFVKGITGAGTIKLSCFD
jgi:hypothetical protein